MATGNLNPVIDHLRRVVLLRDGAGLTDGQLLESFINRKDEAAFEALVRRHGPMVLGVCRRVLHNHHDAEDAFQATFLVLVRKAASIVPREMVAKWLYGVAYRTALKARGLIAKRKSREKQVTEMPEPEAVVKDERWPELQPLLDQELSRLPDKYRVPVVLCDLEGKTGKEAARQLTWPEGTVASRLSRGRGMLAKRLTRHSVTLSSETLAVVLSQNAASACVPTSLAATTVKAASLLAAGQAVMAGLISPHVTALMEGVLKAMLINKVKMVLVFGMIGVLGTGLGSVSVRVAANDKPVPSDAKHTQSVRRAQDGPLQDSPKAKEVDRSDKDAANRIREASRIAFEISSEIAKILAQKPAGQKNPPDQANQMLDMVLKGLQAYQDAENKGKKAEEQEFARSLWDTLEKSYRPPDGKKAGADKEMLDQYREAFLKAFEISSALTRAKGRGQEKIRSADEAVLDAYRATFLQAYEQAKTLEEQKASDRRGTDQAVQALDAFLKAGQELEQAMKQCAKTQAIDQAKQEIENALRTVERTAHDRRTELEILDEIERAVQDMKKKVQDKKEGK
jgi:RNA polymerase sigma factor (sigma-70 family)